jgi:hypothetical protein
MNILEKIDNYLSEGMKKTFKAGDLDSPDDKEFKLIKKGESFNAGGVSYTAVSMTKDTITGTPKK